MKFIYVDNSNLLYGGRGAARHAGLYEWNLDYNALRLLLCGECDCVRPRPKVFGSFSDVAVFKNIIDGAGFKLIGYEKNNNNNDGHTYFNKEKKVDVAIAHQITKDAYSGRINKERDEILLVSGDRDFVPVVEDLVEECFIVHIYSWDHALASELKNVCSLFTSLTPHLDELNRAVTSSSYTSSNYHNNYTPISPDEDNTAYPPYNQQNVTEEAIGEFIAQRIQDIWEETRKPYFLSAIGMELGRRFPDYKTLLAEEPLKDFLYRLADGYGYKICQSQKFMAKVGLIPAQENYSYSED